MNKFFKVAVIIFVVLFLVLGFNYYRLFFMGSDDLADIKIDKISVANDYVEIKGYYLDTAYAYKDYSYTLVDKDLYVSVKHVLVSNKYKDGSFLIKIPENGNNINTIYLTDGKNTKIIS